MRLLGLLVLVAAVSGCVGEPPNESPTDSEPAGRVRITGPAKAEPFVIEILNETYRFPRADTDPRLPNVTIDAPRGTTTLDLLVAGTLECDTGQALAEWSGTRFRFHGPDNATREVTAKFESTGDDGGTVLCNPLNPPPGTSTWPDAFLAREGPWTIEFLGTCTCRVDLVVRAFG